MKRRIFAKKRRGRILTGLDELGKKMTAGVCRLGWVLNTSGVPPLELCCGGDAGSAAVAVVPQRTTATVARPGLSGKVNRTLPEVAPPKEALEFSRQPTEAEFFRARL